jgi:hypothetical protein
MSWRIAKSLDALLAQLNALYPHRDKSSDGSIGDLRHQHESSSDHNPHLTDSHGQPVVTARDFTNDPINGMPSQELAERLVASRDARIKYVISNKKIVSGTGQDHAPWVWRDYTGVNPHNHHVHLSVKSDEAHFDNIAPWDLAGAASPVAKPDLVAVSKASPILRIGSKGPLVEALQRALGFKDAAVDGDFGPKTENALRSFQKSAGLVVDGVAGKYTVEAVNAVKGKA